MENQAKGISTRLKNQMKRYIGKRYNYYWHGQQFMWTVTIKGLISDTGYFSTEVNEGDNVWQSNASYGEVTNNIKKGLYIEA